jgi:copper transporter 1
VPPLYRALRAVLYGASVGLSFFLMLVFMTYNVCLTAYFLDTDRFVCAQAYLIFAVILGAAVGHYILGGTIEPSGPADKGMACH